MRVINLINALRPHSSNFADDVDIPSKPKRFLHIEEDRDNGGWVWVSTHNSLNDALALAGGEPEGRWTTLAWIDLDAEGV